MILTFRVGDNIVRKCSRHRKQTKGENGGERDNLWIGVSEALAGRCKMKRILVPTLILSTPILVIGQEAPVTFVVIDTLDQNYSPGFTFKGSWDTLDPHPYDSLWGGGHLYEMYDDGNSAHGDSMAGDHIWSAVLRMIPDGGANDWKWGVCDTSGNWIDGNWEFQVIDETPQTLHFLLPAGISIEVAVTFSVYMGRQDTASYQGGVSVQGNQLPLDWTPGSTLLEDPDNDTVYTVEVAFPAGTDFFVEYKYTSNDGSNWNWESFGGNRWFLIDDSSPTQLLPMNYYNNDAGTSVRDVTVTSVYNCAAFADSIQSGVWLVGSEPPLYWGAPDLSNPMDSVGNWIYKLEVTFPDGANRYVEFKAIIDADINGWDEDELPGLNRYFIIDDTDSVQVLDTLYYDNQKPTAVYEEDIYSPRTSLFIQNFPNPFSRTTLITYSLKKTSWVTLKIYDITGSLVTTLTHGLSVQGIHQIPWDGTDSRGEIIPAGVYFCRLEGAGSFGLTKLVIIR